MNETRGKHEAALFTLKALGGDVIGQSERALYKALAKRGWEWLPGIGVWSPHQSAVSRNQIWENRKK